MTVAILKVGGAVLLALVLLLCVGVAALFLLDWNVIKGDVEALLSEALNREVRIGSLDLDPGWTSRVRLADIWIANPAWAEDPALAAVDEIAITIKVWPLLGGNIEIPSATVRRARVSMERNADGVGSWAPVETVGEVAAPDTRTEFPAIGQLTIADSTIRYRDAIRQLATEAKIAKAEAKASGPEEIETVIKGSLNDQQLELTFAGGSLNTLHDVEKPYPVDLSLTVGETRLTAVGHVMEPLELRGFDVQLNLKGPSLADSFPMLAIPLPDTPPYSLSGAVGRDGEVWTIRNFKGTVGDSDLSGVLSLDESTPKPMLKAELVSRRLDFDDLSGLIGAPPDPNETANDEQKAEAREESKAFGIVPDTRLADERMQAMNMMIEFDAKQVVAEGAPIENLSARLDLTDGRVALKPLSLTVAGGEIEGEIALNASEKVPSADAHLTFDNLDLTPFFKGTELVQEMGGRFSGQVDLLGTGESLHEILGTARGKAWLGIRDGSISGLLVEGIGLDIVEALVLVIEDDTRIRLRCGRMDLDVSDGVLAAERAVIDTSDSILLARGTVDLFKEAYDLQIEAQAKDFSLIDASAPVVISGTFEDPSISIGGLDPLPFLEMGEAEDIDCDQLLAGKIQYLEPKAGEGGDAAQN